VLAIRCTSLVKRYADVVAVAGVDLAVETGECFGLLGPNGAGKTTTIEILEGLTVPDAGAVEVLGMRWDDGAGRALRERLGIQLQETQLADKLTVEETVRLFRSFYRHSHTVDEVLALVELEEKRRARVVTLSGGQKQRLAVACALVSRPELLFLDEPTTGLDLHSRNELWEMIRELVADGTTVLLTTQYLEEADRLANDIAVVDGGKVIARGTPAELKSRLGSTVIELALADEGNAMRAEAVVAPFVPKRPEREGSTLRLTSDDGPRVLIEVLRSLDAEDLTPIGLAVREPSLDDVLLSLTGRHAEPAAVPGPEAVPTGGVE